MSALHCFFCGGKECKYENWKLWTGEKYQGVNAIDGLFSNWITSDILAMQRPSTRLIKEFDLINVFKAKGIGAVFNLQSKGEHLSCGDGVEPSSGFSYLPETLIENGIKYYNFGWTDMDTPDVNLMLNIVNVMAYALEDGDEKIAVHCHAGLGRTGLSIACYLIYSENIPAEAAILIVRGKRPLSVQTRKQSMFVVGFEKHLKKLKIVFPHAVEKAQKLLLNIGPMSFRESIDNQRRWLKNPDLRFLRYIPKLVHVIINRLLVLCGENELNWYNTLDSFVLFEGIEKRTEKINSFQMEINNAEWACIKMEKDVKVLVDLLLDWFINLKDPLLNEQKVKALSAQSLSWDEKYEILGKEEFETINLVLKFFRQMPSISKTTLDTALETLTILFTEDRSTLKHFVNMNPTIPKPPLATDTYGTRMFDSFKSITISRAVVPPVITATSETGGPAKAPTEISVASVASFSVFQNIQKSAEALSQVAVGSATMAMNGVVAVTKSVVHELPPLPGSIAVVVDGKEKPVEAGKTINLPELKSPTSSATPMKSRQNSEKKIVVDSSTEKPPLQREKSDLKPSLSPIRNASAPIEELKPKSLDKLPAIDNNASTLKTVPVLKPSRSEEVLNRSESIKLLLHHIYKTCGSVTGSEMTDPPLQNHFWTSPVEMLQQMPKSSLTDNLADKFATEKGHGFHSNGNLKRPENLSYSASDLPSLIAKGGKEKGEAPLSLSRRKSSSVGFLPIDNAAVNWKTNGDVVLAGSNGRMLRSSADQVIPETEEPAIMA